MIKTFIIYVGVLTAATFMTPNGAHALSSDRLVFEHMTPVHADGKDPVPVIMDFTKNPDADRLPASIQRRPKKTASRRFEASRSN